MKKAISDPLTMQQQAELDALAALAEDQIDTGDLPEQRCWDDATRGLFYRPVKRQLTLRLDADLIEWFKSGPLDGAGYQTRINKALREYVALHGKTRQTVDGTS